MQGGEVRGKPPDPAEGFSALHKNNMTTHTPAPWKIGVRQPSSDKFIYGPLGEEIADCERLLNTPKENLGNARLIASSPELLSALQEVKEWILRDEESLEFGHVSMSSEMLNERFQNVRDAISKATGEEVK
jgi:hypothetical protein